MSQVVEIDRMKCPGCRQEAPADAVFCPHCGQRIDAAAGESKAAWENPVAARSASGETNIYTEEELWAGRYSPRAMIGTWIVTGLITVGLVIAAAVWNERSIWLAAVVAIVLMEAAAGLTLLYRRLSIRYRLTTQRFIQEKGILSRQTDRIDIIDINDIRVEQGPVQRMLGLGTIIVMANDRTDSNLSMPGIENVNHVADLMDNARRAVQRRRGLRIDVNAGDGIDHQHG